jgi:carboxymethylenebutenolidase
MSADPKGLGALFDAHTHAEFKTRDIEATMATMSASPHVTHVPTMTGGSGRDQVRRFYETWFIGHWPEDTIVTPISRTVGETQVVDEVMISFTHDCEMPALLPGVKPTGRKVTIPFVVVVGFKDGRIEFERIYWDQASMLAQLGLIDSAKLPVSSAEQAARLLDPNSHPTRSFPSAETQLLRLGLLLPGLPGLRFGAGCGSDFDFVTCFAAGAS